MLKWLAILAVLSAAQHPTPTDGIKQQEHPQTQPSPAKPIAPSPLSEDAKKKRVDGEKDAPQEPKAKKYLEDAFAPANLSNWILAGLGIIAGVMAGITLRVIIKQANHMEKQTGLIETQAKLLEQQADLMAIQTGIQKASLMQWVDIQPIEIIVSTTSKSEPPERIALTLRWKILNNTPLPFTVNRIEIHILKSATEEINVVEETQVIPPAKEGSRNFHPFFVETNLNKSETKDFLERGILLTIQIEISYIDAAREATSRFFGEHYWCEKNTLSVSGEHLGKAPQKKVEKYDSPSTLSHKEMRTIEWEETSDSPQESQEPN